MTSSGPQGYEQAPIHAGAGAAAPAAPQRVCPQPDATSPADADLGALLEAFRAEESQNAGETARPDDSCVW